MTLRFLIDAHVRLRLRADRSRLAAEVTGRMDHDQFDRLLVAQGRLLEIPLFTVDRKIGNNAVEIIRAWE